MRQVDGNAHSLASSLRIRALQAISAASICSDSRIRLAISIVSPIKELAQSAYRILSHMILDQHGHY